MSGSSQKLRAPGKLAALFSSANADPSNLGRSLLEGNKDRLLNQARSDLMKQEHQVGSLNNCASELQQQSLCSKIGITGRTTMTKRPCQKNRMLEKMQAKKAVTSRILNTRKGNCQSMIGRQQKIMHSGQDGACLLTAVSPGLLNKASDCRRNIDFPRRRAAFENQQIDKAMAATGTAQNLKVEENVTVAREGRSKSVQAGLEQATTLLGAQRRW